MSLPLTAQPSRTSPRLLRSATLRACVGGCPTRCDMPRAVCLGAAHGGSCSEPRGAGGARTWPPMVNSHSLYLARPARSWVPHPAECELQAPRGAVVDEARARLLFAHRVEVCSTSSNRLVRWLEAQRGSGSHEVADLLAGPSGRFGALQTQLELHSVTHKCSISSKVHSRSAPPSQRSARSRRLKAPEANRELPFAP